MTRMRKVGREWTLGRLVLYISLPKLPWHLERQNCGVLSQSRFYLRDGQNNMPGSRCTDQIQDGTWL
jgi:hypothetical protein